MALTPHRHKMIEMSVAASGEVSGGGSGSPVSAQAPSNGQSMESSGRSIEGGGSSCCGEVDEQQLDLARDDETCSPPMQGNTKEKTPMCLINELARFNNAQHQYRLVEEQGPPHKKMFTVVLKLGTSEEYTASGTSIKRARHAAAQLALQKTSLKHPTPKTTGKGSNGPLTPTVELNALAMKRGEPAVYRVVEISRVASAYLPPSLNYRGMAYTRYHYPRLPPSYRAILDVGDRKFIGEGNTEQAARHAAAEVALACLRSLPLPEQKKNVIYSGESGDENEENKSAISVVYEMALKRNLQVEFEVVNETGPPHMRKYTTKCTVGEVSTEGTGNGKKVSKKEAAEKMVAELRKLSPPGSVTSNNNVSNATNNNMVISETTTLVKKKQTVKKKSRNLIKEQKPDGTFYGQGINPISRLIQIQQAKKEKEPVYTVVAERGEPRAREFIIQCSLDGGTVTTQGIGPNKKTAKRKAAEAMLTQLGYSKPQAAQAPLNNKVAQDAADSNGKPGSKGGRQLVPGLLLMPSEKETSLNGAVEECKIHSSVIAKGLLDKGVSPTAQSLSSSSNATPAKANKATKIASATTPTGGESPLSGALIKPKEQLLYLAKVLGIQVSFTDFPKGSEFLSLVALTSNPPQVCHGSGKTVEEAQDEAAHSILNNLAQIGIDSIATATPAPSTPSG